MLVKLTNYLFEVLDIDRKLKKASDQLRAGQRTLDKFDRLDWLPFPTTWNDANPLTASRQLETMRHWRA